VSGLSVLNPGMLTLLQDQGRYGQHRIGLTNGGPLDRLAMAWANRLVHNQANATVLEVSFGGLELEAGLDTLVCLTGGDLVLSINGQERESWRSHRVVTGDRIAVGFATVFCRAYLAVAGGFQVERQFGSTATVVREGIGGLDGHKLDAGALLACNPCADGPCLVLPDAERPQYASEITIRVIPGYQHKRFPQLQQSRFYAGEYSVTDRADRMGYRLQGPAIECDIEGILSEGICMGAIQIPADGQPIVLLQDRQTIGGYPKIGAALSMDTARLAQLMPGGQVHFEEISAAAAHNAFSLAQSRFHRLEPESCDG
jgi:biotin-dependent carboxylase-like uncharacterized protein